MTRPVARPLPKSDDGDSPIVPPPSTLTVEDTPTRIVLPDGRTWRRRIGFCPRGEQD